MKKKIKRAQRIILEPEDEKDYYKDFAPHMYFPYEDNKKCAVMINCPTHKSAKDLIKQILKDQKDMTRIKKQLKEYKDKEKRQREAIREHMEWQEKNTYHQDYNEP